MDDEGFHPTVLVYWRNRISRSQRPRRVFEVAATAVLAGRRRRVLDSTILEDAVATQDTVTQLVAAKRRVRRLLPQARAVKLGAHDGAVAFATTAFEQRDCRHENAPTSPCSCPTLHLSGFRFPPDVIVIAVRWYLRFSLSYRDVEELLAERGVEVDHVTVYRWVQRFTPLLAEAARPCRHAVGQRWLVDETYVKVAGRWRYLYRAIDQFGQVIDVVVSPDVTRKQPTSSSSGQSVRPESGRLRSSPTEHRPIRWSSMAYCQRPGTAPTGTPTTPSRPITAG